MKHLFILGNPRSGTSLFRVMLNNHPNTICPPECGFAHWWLSKYSNWKMDDNSSIRLEEFLNDLLISKKIETWQLLKEDLRKVITKRNPINYSELVDCIYLSYSKNINEIEVIADKNNYYINYLNDLRRIWSNAKFIHIIRDGRDVACSYMEVEKLKTTSPYKPKLSTSISSIANEWQNNNKSILEFTSGLARQESFFIKYENLISDPINTLKMVCEFIEIKYSSKMLDYYKTNDNKRIEPLQTLDWKKKTLEKPDSSKIGRYKYDLTKQQITEFNIIALNSLKLFRYDF